jgi:hypothetical protein
VSMPWPQRISSGTTQMGLRPCGGLLLSSKAAYHMQAQRQQLPMHTAPQAQCACCARRAARQRMP